MALFSLPGGGAAVVELAATPSAERVGRRTSRCAEVIITRPRLVVDRVPKGADRFPLLISTPAAAAAGVVAVVLFFP